MIKEHERFRFEDEAGEGEFYIDVNWTDDEKIKDCKLLKFTFLKSKHTYYVKKEHFYSFLFAIGAPSEQRDIVPSKQRKVKWYETTVSIKAKRNINKGEDIIFPIKLSLPDTEEEVIIKNTPSRLILPSKS